MRNRFLCRSLALFYDCAWSGSSGFPSSAGLSRLLFLERHRHRRVRRKANPLPLDVGDQSEVDEMTRPLCGPSPLSRFASRCTRRPRGSAGNARTGCASTARRRRTSAAVQLSGGRGLGPEAIEVQEVTDVESPVLEVSMSRRAMWKRPRRVGCNPHRDFSLMRALRPLQRAIAGLQFFEGAL